VILLPKAASNWTEMKGADPGPVNSEALPRPSEAIKRGCLQTTCAAPDAMGTCSLRLLSRHADLDTLGSGETRCRGETAWQWETHSSGVAGVSTTANIFRPPPAPLGMASERTLPAQTAEEKTPCRPVSPGTVGCLSDRFGFKPSANFRPAKKSGDPCCCQVGRT